MKEELLRVYNALRLANYRGIFSAVQERAGSLSATEAFSADVIYLLERPTVTGFASFLGISQPNASYKIAALVSKGYVARDAAGDRRESRLIMTDKFRDYLYAANARIGKSIDSVMPSFSAEEQALLCRLLSRVAEAAAAETVD